MNAVAVYDFTLKASDDDYSAQAASIKSGLSDIAKKYSFQLEKSDNGYIHWQGRISLIKKRRLNECIKVFHSKQIFENIHISITHDIDSDFYVLKCDTYVEPHRYKDTDEERYIPRQVREITKLYPWQQYIIDNSLVWDTRSINIIIDTDGNNGKSTLVSYMRAHGMARKIPFCNDYKDIMRMVCDMPTSKCYLIDMPRAVNKDRLFQLYGAIKEIKSGYAYDDRYKFTEKIFDCPNIWIFCNAVPDLTMLSQDRWKFWVIKDQNLITKSINELSSNKD